MPEMEQHGATLVNEDDYPWVARVIHGHHKNQVLEPLICTAAAIKRRVFITAARCIVTAKALYTTILYKHREIGVKAFIFPAIPSKQMFDDVGVA
ncbi:uncharacterized protein LOC134678140 [Cydia fagiglandana]|uniref:uncharacterized protein LOC134678140 n=1 Tax=Cydia fagiglandana TaxID=1458189 RepID=UPI002FEE0971